jgi:hypothetical protein
VEDAEQLLRIDRERFGLAGFATVDHGRNAAVAAEPPRVVPSELIPPHRFEYCFHDDLVPS